MVILAHRPNVRWVAQSTLGKWLNVMEFNVTLLIDWMIGCEAVEYAVATLLV